MRGRALKRNQNGTALDPMSTADDQRLKDGARRANGEQGWGEGAGVGRV